MPDNKGTSTTNKTHDYLQLAIISIKGRFFNQIKCVSSELPTFQPLFARFRTPSKLPAISRFFFSGTRGGLLEETRLPLGGQQQISRDTQVRTLQECGTQKLGG